MKKKRRKTISNIFHDVTNCKVSKVKCALDQWLVTWSKFTLKYVLYTVRARLRLRQIDYVLVRTR